MRIDAELRTDAQTAGWFVARQPAVVRFLERRCGPTDAFAVALDAAVRICAAFERAAGVPPPPVPFRLLDRADDALAIEALGPGAARGLAARHPELCAWIARWVADPPLPLTAAEAGRVGACLTAVVYALDEITTGRPVP
ncbi:MAG: hypothetical protein D6689_16335 [Deltaproteobacteria bacterium]|nr:MAG: hypothetical protein D6689_16335 [Deltaproteobacteria bacterium]